MKISKGLMCGIIIILGVTFIIIETKEERKALQHIEEVMKDIEDIDYNIENVYKNIAKINKLEDDGSINNEIVSIEKKSSLLSDDFNRCEFRVLGIWNESGKENRIYANEEVETEIETTKSDEVYYVESNGQIEQITASSEEESSETEVETVEELDIAKTYIVIEVSKYYNSETVNNLNYEIYNENELLGNTKDSIGLKNIVLNNGYTNSRIDLIEMDGALDINKLNYKASVSNGDNTIENIVSKIAITEHRESENYTVSQVGNTDIVFIRKEPVLGSNRIEIVENIKESSEYAPSESTEVTEEIVDELYTLTYNFECWGKADIIKTLNGSNATLINSETKEEFLDIKNIQCKFNDSKYNIDERNKFIELDFSINIQILKSQLNNYLIEIEKQEINSNTINTIKSKFDRIFSLQFKKDGIDMYFSLN